MSTPTLQAEARECLTYIQQRFLVAMQGNAEYPLAKHRACRAFAQCVEETLTEVRKPSSRLPPTALILAMIRVCDDILDPGPEALGKPRGTNCIPRAFAYEMLDRLQAEIPATPEFALDQVGRIMTEAGTQGERGSLRRAFTAFRLRMRGAAGAAELEALVSQIWRRHDPASAVLIETPAVAGPDSEEHHTSWMAGGTGMFVFDPTDTAITNITQTLSEYFAGGSDPYHYADGLAALASI